MNGKDQVQETLFDVASIPEAEPVEEPRWYYYTSVNNDAMIMLGDDGVYRWYEHDLSQVVPCLWNVSQTCRKAMKAARLKGRVRLYPFSSHRNR